MLDQGAQKLYAALTTGVMNDGSERIEPFLEFLWVGGASGMCRRDRLHTVTLDVPHRCSIAAIRKSEANRMLSNSSVLDRYDGIPPCLLSIRPIGSAAVSDRGVWHHVGNEGEA
jgi:hypothetical protein